MLIPLNMYDPRRSMTTEAAGGSWVLEGPRVCCKDGERERCVLPIKQWLSKCQIKLRENGNMSFMLTYQSKCLYLYVSFNSSWTELQCSGKPALFLAWAAQ